MSVSLGSSSCTCIGKNRAFQHSDGSCLCRTGFVFYNELDFKSSTSDSELDCQPEVSRRLNIRNTFFFFNYCIKYPQCFPSLDSSPKYIHFHRKGNFWYLNLQFLFQKFSWNAIEGVDWLKVCRTDTPLKSSCESGEMFSSQLSSVWRWSFPLAFKQPVHAPTPTSVYHHKWIQNLQNFAIILLLNFFCFFQNIWKSI